MNKKDINVTPATNASLSVTVGDVIADSQDNKATIVYIDYVGDIVVAVDGSEATNISFDVLAGGEYQQVVENQIVLVFLLLLLQIVSDNEYVAVADSSPKVGDEIIDSEGNKYDVVEINYVRCMLDAVSTDGKKFRIPFRRFVSGEYNKVVHQMKFGCVWWE